MKSYASHNRFVMLEHFVEPFAKRDGETDVEAMQRILGHRAHTGWELVDVCGDELRKPTLVFRRMPDAHDVPLYLVEEISDVKGKGEVETVTEYLYETLEENWVPACIVDSPFTTPIAVLKRSKVSTEGMTVRAIPIAPEFFGKIASAIKHELYEQQLKNNLTLACVMHGGIHPVLIMVSKETDEPYEYEVMHANGGFFANQTTTLSELIQSMSIQGWHVCGTFEDVFLWPCVIFRKETSDVPGVITGPL